MHEELAVEIKAHAIGQLDFSLIGITGAAPLPGAERLAKWLAQGRAGDMPYLARTAGQRGDPGQLLAGAKSVLCVAMSYHDPPEEPELEPRGVAVVARYARRADYHKVIKRRLVRLGRLLSERVPTARWRTAVDTAPLLEKELAQRAGVGWIGKNACLLNRRLGSELLLGELVTDVELPHDEPERDHCGTCSACLEACPTRALARSRTLDARLCISYLTIEHRGALPSQLLPSLGAHLFGCDICQSCCPWNRHAPVSCAPPLRERPHLGALGLPEIAGLDEDGWRRIASGTPLRRLDYFRACRNMRAAASVLGSSLTFPAERNIKPPPEGP